MQELIETRDARAERVAEEASDAFWRVVGERYPEIRTGDFGPGETHEWMSACETAIARWIENNQPAREMDNEAAGLQDPRPRGTLNR